MRGIWALNILSDTKPTGGDATIQRLQSIAIVEEQGQEHGKAEHAAARSGGRSFDVGLRRRRANEDTAYVDVCGT